MEEINLDNFTMAYLTAAFWTNEEELSNKKIADINKEDLLKVKKDCEIFQEDNKKSLLVCYQKSNYSEASAGHDFWLTRNGHGVGFWDRGLGNEGDKLSEASTISGQSDIYLGDNNEIYFTNTLSNKKKNKI